MIGIYIDESGEAGIAKVRSKVSRGASPYFVLGAVACRQEDEPTVVAAFSSFRDKIGKSSWKHATDLTHQEKVLLARTLGTLPVRFFGVISNKATLGEYSDLIENDAQKFYNKCAVYLLEIVAGYLLSRGLSVADTRVVFEERNHDYGRLRRYLARVKSNPQYPQSNSLRDINPYSIVKQKKGSSELLEIADFVAHALYQVANKTDKNFQIPEPRYLVEIQSRFGCSKSGDVIHYGIKCIHSLEQLELDSDVATIIGGLRGSLPKQP